MVPMSTLESMTPTSVVKLYINDYNTAVFKGEGIEVAERMVKQSDQYNVGEEYPYQTADLSGLACDWHKIFPATRGDEVVCYIIKPMNELRREYTIGTCLQKIEVIYGDLLARHPTAHIKKSLLNHHQTSQTISNISTLTNTQHIALKLWLFKQWYSIHSLLTHLPIIVILLDQ